MSNNKSSVDILCQKLANKLGLTAITFYIDHAEEIAEAKAMHKEEMCEFAFKVGRGQDYDDKEVRELSEIMYNETFGGNK